MQNIKEKSFKIIIVLLTSVMLLNIAVPTLVYAAVDQTNKLVEKYNQSAEEGKKIGDPDDFEQFLDLWSYSQEKNEGEEGYDEWVKKAGDYYNDYYKNKIEKYTGEKYTDPNDRKTMTKEYQQYLYDKKADYNEKVNNIPDAQSRVEEPIVESAPHKEKDPEKIKYIKALLENDDEGYQGFWENIGEEIAKNVFGTICSFATTIADAVVNTLQDLMLSCSPTAVTKRENKDYIIDKLENREDDSYIICYAGKSKYPELDHESVTIEEIRYAKTSITEVPFIYYSPATILSNKVPLFDVNFIGSKNNRIITPFLAEEDGTTYREGSDEDAKERIQATETNGIFKDRIGELEKEIDEARDDAKGDNLANPVSTLQGAISKWYITLRNISLVGLLIVLIYLGIRITISAAADEKAKYKAILKDWVMAVVLVVMLHVIMLFLITVTNIVINALDNASLDFVNDPYRWRYVNEQNKNINSIKYKKPKLDITTWIYINIHSISMVFNSIHMEICKKVNLYGFSNNDSTISRFNISNR